RFAVEARLEFIGQTNTPGSAWRELFAGDNAVVEQTMDRRGSDTKRGGGLLDGQKIAGGLRFFLEARDLPVPAEITDAIAVEAVAVNRRAALPVEDTGDHGIGIMHCQSSQERNCILVGADRRWPRSG